MIYEATLSLEPNADSSALLELKTLLEKRSALANPSNFGEGFERLIHAFTSRAAEFSPEKMQDIETGSNFHGIDEVISSIAESEYFHQFDLKFLALLNSAESIGRQDPKAFKFALYGAMLTQDINMARRKAMASTLVSLGISENEIAVFHENRKSTLASGLGALDYETYADFSELAREVLGEVASKKSIDDGDIRQLIAPIVEDVASSETDAAFFGKIAVFGRAVEKSKMSEGFKVKLNFCEVLSNRSSVIETDRFKHISKYLSLHVDDSGMSLSQKTALRRCLKFLNMGEDDGAALSSVVIKLLRFECLKGMDQDETLEDAVKPFASHLSSIPGAERFEKNIDAFTYMLENSGFKNKFSIKSALCQQWASDGSLDKDRLRRAIDILTKNSEPLMSASSPSC